MKKRYSVMALVLAACAAAPSKEEEVVVETPAIDWPAGVATDETKIRDIELVIGRGANLQLLHELEIPILERPTEKDGEQVVSILTTGADAERLRAHGFVPSLPRVHTRGPGLVPLAPSPAPPIGSCSNPQTIDTSDCTFPLYQSEAGLPACNGGILQEAKNMAAVVNDVYITPAVFGTTFQGKEIVAVRFGPQPADDVPTHYILATHHAREWLAASTALGLMRWLRNVVVGNEKDEVVSNALKTMAVVIVPVANPDGYQYSHVPTGKRDQRTNMHAPAGCGTMGVDINRNYEGDWNEVPVDSVSHSACSDVWQGPAASSEPETQAMVKLLTGGVDEYKRPKGLTAISYHTYGDLVIYPSASKATDDGDGPICSPNGNCLQPDFDLLRTLFGGDKVHFMTDDFKPDVKYFADLDRSNGYSTTGDMTKFASRTMLSATFELGGNGPGFYPECLSTTNRTIAVNHKIEEQKGILRRLFAETPKLVNGYPSFTAGNMGPTHVLREKIGNRDNMNAVPRFVIPVTKDYPDQKMNLIVDSVPTDFPMVRRGAQYNAFAYEAPDPNVLPCDAHGKNYKGGAEASGCNGGVKLCDSSRLPISGGWQHFKDERADGSLDCGYRANPSSSTSAISLFSVVPSHTDTTRCDLSFTLRWSANFSQSTPVRLERKPAGTSSWQEVTRWPLEDPFYELRTTDFSDPVLNGGENMSKSLRSFSFQVGGAGGTPTDDVRIVYDGTSPGPFEVLDPVIYCRYGSIN